MENLSGSTPPFPVLDTLRILVGEQVDEDLLGGQLSSQEVQKLLAGLPRIQDKELVDIGESDSSCSICFTPYLTILTEEEMALAMDSPARPSEELGVTKLSQPWQCGHLFCRRDITKWITSGHASCPMCRQLLVEEINERGSVSEDIVAAEARAQERDHASAFLDAHMWDMETLLRESGVDPPETLTPINLSQYSPANSTQRENHRHEFSGMYS